MKTFFSACFLLFSCLYLWAGNGLIAYAYPLAEIKIDGELNDWPAHLKSYPIADFFGEAISHSKDLSASFRVGYQSTTQQLYLAIEIIDDVYFSEAEGQNDWLRQDGLLLYFDRHHLPKGSGSILYMLCNQLRSVESAVTYMDPLNAGMGWETIDYAINRLDDRTLYEVALVLPQVQSNQLPIYGLDLLINDQDSSGEAGSGLLWGPEFGKSKFAGRLGEVVLLEAEVPTYLVSGWVGWEGGTMEQSIGRVVRIESTDRPNWFIEAALDSNGHYIAPLPPGNYQVRLPTAMTNYRNYDSSAERMRFDERKSVAFSVVASSIEVPKLELSPIALPTYLYPDEGLLLGYSTEQALLVDNFVETIRQHYHIPGVSVGIVKDYELVYHRNFGLASNLTGQPVSDTTLFEAASITKPVFAFAVMRLAERGLIDLDRPLYEYLPFSNIAKDERSKLLTARIILCHRSGLPNWAFGGPFGYMSGQETELNFEPGSQWGYSGEAYNYLGRVLEAIMDQPLAQILKEEVTDVLGMEQSWFATNPILDRRSAQGHEGFLPTFWETIGHPSPASSLHTQAGDFSRFMIGVMQQRGLRSATYTEWLEPQHTLPKEDQVYPTSWPQELALGLFTQPTDFGRLYEHGGNNGDFHCKFGIIPERGDGYVIFTNSNNGERLVRAFELLMLEGYPY
ncbi:MAG: serine hydrolase [Bacteroidota bacterium]